MADIKRAGAKFAEAFNKASNEAEAAYKAAKQAEKTSKLDEALKAKQAPMTTPQGTGLPLMPRDQGMYTPGVEQKDLPRMPMVDKARAKGEKPKYTERMQDLLDSPTARKKVDTLIQKGDELGMREWYGTEPLRQVAMDIGMSQKQFDEFLAQMASASQRNPVDQQNRMGSYLWHLSQTGQLPEDAFLMTNKIKRGKQERPAGTAIELPPGYGSLAQGDIFSRGKQIAAGDIEGALPPDKKLGTFYRNYQGNLRPVTVDVNAVRGPIIERGDPRWLASKLVEKDEEGNVIATHFPRKQVESGLMSIKQAKERPGFWEAAPSGSEYAGFEDLWQRAAKRKGIAPAEAQALGWYGSADVTALKTKPELYIENLERMIRRTAEQTGQNPRQVMEDVLRGKTYLKKDGGKVSEDEYQKKLDAMIANHMGMAKGGEVFKKLAFKADGGTVDNTMPDTSDSGQMLYAQRYAEGGEAKFSNEQIANFISDVQARGGSSAEVDAEIAAAMDNFGVSPEEVARATGSTVEYIQDRYNAAQQGGKYDTTPEIGGVVLAGDSWLSGPDHASRISEQIGGGDVTNVAVGGSKTTDVLNQLDSFIGKGGRFRPDTTVMLDIGGNDLLSGASPEEIERNISRISSTLGDRGVNVILSGAPTVRSIDDITGSTSLALDPLYQRVADANKNVTLVDSMPGLLNQKNLVDDTGFHMNEVGRNAFNASLSGAYRKSKGMGEFEVTPDVVRQYVRDNRLSLEEAKGIAPYFDLTEEEVEQILTERAANGGAMKALPWKAKDGGMAEGGSEIPFGEKAKLMAEIMARMAKEQGKEEVGSLKKKGAVTDLINRGVIAPFAGIPVDLINMGLEGVDYLREKATGKPLENRLASDKPVGGSEFFKDKMRQYGMTTDTERPMMETGLSILSPSMTGAAKGAVKAGEAAQKGARAVESGLNTATAAARRPFTPATVTVEAVAPDLAKFKPRQWQETATKRMITGEGAPVSMSTMGGKSTTKRPGQGVYLNEAGQLETNPLVAVDVPFAGDLSKNKALRADIATAGGELAQEAMAAHRFVPMMTNEIKDASAMLIKPKKGALTNEEVKALGEALPGMIVAHNPRLGGVVVAPFEMPKGQIPTEFLDAQTAAQAILGKNAKITYGKAEQGKDLMYMGRSDYATEGAREPSGASQAMRKRLQKAEGRLFAEPERARRGLGAMRDALPATVD